MTLEVEERMASEVEEAGLLSDDEELPEEDQFGRAAYLRACAKMGISPASQVLKFLETSEMHIHHYGLGLKGTLALVEALKVNSIITSVRLTNNNIPDEGLAALVECVATRPHVIDLDASGNKIGSATARALSVWLGQRGVPLQSLMLSHMHLGDKDGALVCAALENNDGLRMLDMSNNALGEKSAVALAASLQTNLMLMDLNLSWNQFRPKGVAHLAQGLKPNLSLQLLGLAWCGMADAGAEAFGEMLVLNQRLADIDLCGNQITLCGIGALCAGIAKSKSLAVVALDNNDLREEGGRKLLEAVEANGGLVKMRLDNTNTSYELRTTIEQLLAPRLAAQQAS
ncbi:hypothetical protein FOA52_005470 [Chlamydomonas sp. UWO 241]|nr:hypothetical protein FOA52_005470 [Chlamydomonas sp. UWO 241]